MLLSSGWTLKLWCIWLNVKIVLWSISWKSSIWELKLCSNMHLSWKKLEFFAWERFFCFTNKNVFVELFNLNFLKKINSMYSKKLCWKKIVWTTSSNWFLKNVWFFWSKPHVWDYTGLVSCYCWFFWWDHGLNCEFFSTAYRLSCMQSLLCVWL